MHETTTVFGVVAIGRNEGERLERCLASLAPSGAPVVYVDSGSTDGSVGHAESRGCAVAVLDPGIPFTAARARNQGLERLLELHPGLELVQFVDGDCEVAAGWLARAVAELSADPGLGAVCGRRRERFRERTIYNRLCDIEWDSPVGETKACGGDAMMRVRAVRAAGGYDEAVIAGEDDELCVRIRREGWRIRRIDAEMTIHDAAMTKASQWWRRAVRAGHCFAQGFALHGSPPERLWLRKNLSVLFNAAALPLVALGAAAPTGGASLLLLAWYPLSVLKTYRKTLRRGLPPRDAWAWAISCWLSNLPNLVGQAKYVAARLRRRPTRIIEYKGAQGA
jgi:GT2 family glycosyltransferase